VGTPSVVDFRPGARAVEPPKSRMRMLSAEGNPQAHKPLRDARLPAKDEGTVLEVHAATAAWTEA